MVIGHVTVESIARVESLCACAAAVAGGGGEMFGLQMALASKPVPVEWCGRLCSVGRFRKQSILDKKKNTFEGAYTLFL